MILMRRILTIRGTGGAQPVGSVGLEEMEEEDPLLSQNPLLTHLDRLRGARSLNLNRGLVLSLPVTPMSHKVITTNGGNCAK